MHINFLAILNDIFLSKTKTSTCTFVKFCFILTVQIVGVFIHVKNRSEKTLHISMDNYMHGDLCPPSVSSEIPAGEHIGKI